MPIIVKLTCGKSVLKIDIWLDMFERIVTSGLFSKDRIFILARYVSEEAFNCYGQEIAATIDTLQLPEVKHRMVTRFGQVLVHPY